MTPEAGVELPTAFGCRSHLMPQEMGIVYNSSLTDYSLELLLRRAKLSGWHNLGMNCRWAKSTYHFRNGSKLFEIIENVLKMIRNNMYSKYILLCQRVPIMLVMHGVHFLYCH